MAKQNIVINDTQPKWIVVQKWRNIKDYGLWEKSLADRAYIARKRFLETAPWCKDWKDAYRQGYRCIKVMVISDA